MASFLNQYEILFNKAKADLSAANVLYDRLLKGNSGLDLEVICFHLQQSAEKLMKAILSKNQIYYPKIHDLETLIKKESRTAERSGDLEVERAKGRKCDLATWRLGERCSAPKSL